jgi:hypothetical protein
MENLYKRREYRHAGVDPHTDESAEEQQSNFISLGARNAADFVMQRYGKNGREFMTGLCEELLQRIRGMRD